MACLHGFLLLQKFFDKESDFMDNDLKFIPLLMLKRNYDRSPKAYEKRIICTTRMLLNHSYIANDGEDAEGTLWIFGVEILTCNLVDCIIIGFLAYYLLGWEYEIGSGDFLSFLDNIVFNLRVTPMSTLATKLKDQLKLM